MTPRHRPLRRPTRFGRAVPPPPFKDAVCGSHTSAGRSRGRNDRLMDPAARMTGLLADLPTANLPVTSHCCPGRTTIQSRSPFAHGRTAERCDASSRPKKRRQTRWRDSRNSRCVHRRFFGPRVRQADAGRFTGIAADTGPAQGGCPLQVTKLHRTLTPQQRSAPREARIACPTPTRSSARSATTTSAVSRRTAMPQPRQAHGR